MTKFNLLIFLSASIVLLSSCNQQVGDWIDAKLPDRSDQPSTALITVPYAMKVTPGKMNGSDSGIAVKALVTPTNQTYNLGPDMAVVLTVGRSRSQ